MKRILLISISLLFAFSVTVYAIAPNGEYKGKPLVKVQHNGVEIAPIGPPGYIEDGYTMVPLGMLRAMGLQVDWSNQTYTANVITKTATPTTPPPSKTILTLDQIKSLKDRIALVYALDANGVRKEQGSGFMINSKGMMITARHVIEQDGQYRALEVIVRGKTYKVPAGVVAFEDADKDIAGVYLQDREAFPYLKVGTQNKGDKVSSIGYPKTVLTVLEGKISGYSIIGSKILHTDTPSGGTSGGALLNQYGEVVGVVTGGDSTGGTSTQISDVLNLHQSSFNQ